MTSPNTNPIPAGFLLKEKVAELQKNLLEQHPRIPGLLKEIWQAIKKQPEQVTLLTEEETNVVFQGMEKQLGVFMATAVTEKKSVSSKKVTVASLGL